RRPRESALEEVHQQEGEVIEDVARRDDVAEFDGVEEHRSAIDQDDIAEMKIAVDAADKPAAAALGKEGDDAVIGGAAHSRERVDLRRREDIRVRPERLGMFVDIRTD